jgi:aminoglycoside phosphotransferase (APT) family kinase protein
LVAGSRPRRLDRLRHTTRRATALPVRTPELVDEGTGHLTSRALPGTPLSQLLAGPRRDEALHAVGAAVARLHSVAPPAGSSLHGPGDEQAVTASWERWGRAYGIEVPPSADLPAPAAPPSLRLIHRDLHDGQLLLDVDAGGRFTDTGVGFLDFDLMAAGDPALDLANLVEHLHLRERQGVLVDAGSAVRALLSGYRPDHGVTSRLTAYRALTARRLAVVYAFRAPNLVT